MTGIWCFSRYHKSIEIYEEIARQSLNNNLLKYGVKGHLLNAGICQLCKGDVVAITNALERYQVYICFHFNLYSIAYGWLKLNNCCIFFFQDMDPTFSGTREYRLLSVSYIYAERIFISFSISCTKCFQSVLIELFFIVIILVGKSIYSFYSVACFNLVSLIIYTCFLSRNLLPLTCNLFSIYDGIFSSFSVTFICI